MNIFAGLWQGVSNTIGQGIGFTQHVYDYKNGIAQQNQQFAIDQQQLEIEKQKQTQKALIIGGTILIVLVILIMILKPRKNAA